MEVVLMEAKAVEELDEGDKISELLLQQSILYKDLVLYRILFQH